MINNSDFWGQHIGMKIDLMRNSIGADIHTMNKYFEKEYFYIHGSFNDHIEKSYNQICKKIQLLRSTLQNDESQQIWQFKMEMGGIKRVAEEKLRFKYGRESEHFKILKEKIESKILRTSMEIEDEHRSLVKKLLIELSTATTHLKFEVSKFAKIRNEELANLELKYKASVNKMRTDANENMDALITNIVCEQEVAQENIDRRINNMQIHIKHMRMNQLDDINDMLISMEEESLRGIFELNTIISTEVVKVRTELYSKINSLYHVVFLQINNLQLIIDEIIYSKLDGRVTERSGSSRDSANSDDHSLSRESKMKDKESETQESEPSTDSPKEKDMKLKSVEKGIQESVPSTSQSMDSITKPCDKETKGIIVSPSKRSGSNDSSATDDSKIRKRKPVFQLSEFHENQKPSTSHE